MKPTYEHSARSLKALAKVIKFRGRGREVSVWGSDVTLPPRLRMILGGGDNPPSPGGDAA